MKNLLLILNAVLLLFTLALFLLDPGNVFVSAYSIVVSVLLLYTFKRAHGNLLGFGFVFLVYNLLMHFGFGIIHFLISEKPAKELYARWTLTFLASDNYATAILVSALAFQCFTIAWLVGLKRTRPCAVQACNAIDDDKEAREKYACYILGMLILGFVLLYFVYLFAVGRLSLNMSYLEFREQVMAGNNLYSWVIVLYATGLLYVVASSSGKMRGWGVVLFAMSAVVLLLTGNKGEVFYAVLASLGVLGFQRKKLSKKLVLLLCLIMFVIIPVVTSTRSTNVSEGFSLEFASLTDPFLEIGMQIRCVVYSIDGVADGSYSFMYGYSYLRPFCTLLGLIIFPLRSLPATPIDLSTDASDFFGYGFTQVAEGYLNFGVFGAVLFFLIMGYFIGKLEFENLGTRNLCLVGSLLGIFINMSRNTFIFVPGQALIMLIIYFSASWIAKTKIRSRS